jgi:hypothetical protein
MAVALHAVPYDALVLRVTLLLVAALALASFDALVRSPDAAMLETLPVDGRAWFTAAYPRVALDHAAWPLAAMALLAAPAPSAWTWGLGCAVVAGAFVAALGLGAAVNLGAAGVARAPGWQPLLDAVRGSNPRVQAALLWAPGVAVAGAGLLVIVACAGLAEGLSATPSSWSAPAILVPLAGGGLGLWAATRSARDLPRAAAVLGEIDAAYALADAAAEPHRVYGERLADRLGGRLGSELRRELRHAWRAHRPWVHGAWGLGFLAAWVAWVRGPSWVMTGLVGLALAAIIGARMRGTDPVLADVLLPRAGRRRARLLAIALVAAPPFLLPSLAGVLRAGADALPGAGALALGWAALATAGALLPAGAYLPVALAIVAAGILA